MFFIYYILIFEKILTYDTIFDKLFLRQNEIFFGNGCILLLVEVCYFAIL